MDRVIVNQTLSLPCTIKNVPNSGLLQWLFTAHNSTVDKVMCIKKPDESECVKSKSREPWLENIQTSTELVEIERVTPQHSGTYQCMYIDDSNLEKYMIEVNVLNPPGKPTIQLNPTMIVEGNIVNLTCESSGGNPKTSLKWIWKDFSNKPIGKRNILSHSLKQSDSIYGKTVLSILWKPKSFDDGNSISCLAENQLAAVSSNWMYLNVNYPPIIYDFPKSPHFVLLGTELNLECKATRKTTANFKWLSDKGSILSDTPQLIIKSISRAHKGSYRCVVTNPFGTSSASVNISVLSAPAIEPMPDFRAMEDETLRMVCKVIPSFSNVSWWRNLECVGTTHVLEIKLTGVKAAQFECRATVRLNTFPGHYVFASSKEIVNVKIHYKPRSPNIVVHPLGSLMVRMDATITCITDIKEPGYPKPDYFWRKPNSRWSKNSTNFITFSSLTFDDAGIYICTVFNEIGRSADVRFDLVVHGSPSLTDSSRHSPTLVTVKEGKSFSIFCTFQAYPSPDISWLNDDIPILHSTNNSRFSIKQTQTGTNAFKSVLHIAGTTVHLEEIFRCNAVNKYGTLYHEYNVQVHYAPKSMSKVFMIAADSHGLWPGKGSVKLNCTISANPMVSVTWLRKLSDNNEHSIENSTERYFIMQRIQNNILESVLFVRNFQNEDYGRYFCLAKNREGQLETEFEIRKLSTPDPSHDLILSKQTWNSLTFKWIPGFDGGFRQMFLVSYMTDTQTKPTQLRTDHPNITLTDLLPDTSYTIVVSSSNKLGTTPATLSVKVKTEALTVGGEKILTVNQEEQILELKLPTNLSASLFCLTIEEMDGSQDVTGSSWTIMKRCVRNVYNRVSIENPVNRFRVKICLINLPDVCSNPITNNVVNESSDAILSTKLIGTVAAACTVLVIILAILLFFVLIRTRRLLPKLSDFKDIKRNRKSSKEDFSNYISKPLPSACSTKHGLLLDNGGCPLLNTYSCDPIHLSASPIEIFNVCSTHNIFNEGLYSTLIKSNSINLFSNDLTTTPIYNDQAFIDQSSCYCYTTDAPLSTMSPTQENYNNKNKTNDNNNNNNNNKSDKIFYEVMV